MQVRRFADDLAALSGPNDRIGLAVSGGPDSLALLVLAARAAPGRIAAATVDHRLRPEARAEAEGVANICKELGVPHTILAARWAEAPASSIQARAREERYALLAAWAETEGLEVVATAHHADDQAETLLMRLARGSGAGGLGGIRRERALSDDVRLIRPLLGWRKSDLEAIVADAELEPVDDPANRDKRHDRSRIRALLARENWIDPARLAASAAWLGEADEALEWTLAGLIDERVIEATDGLAVDVAGLPPELQRRLMMAALAKLGAPRRSGPDLARAMAALRDGRTVTLAGFRMTGGPIWRLTRAPCRTPRA